MNTGPRLPRGPFLKETPMKTLFSSPATALLNVACLMALAASAQAQDVAAGKTAFAQCAACHSTNGAAGAGPTLKGIMGSKAGVTSDGFRFSRAMRNSGVTWDAKTLDVYLKNPQTAIPGNVMPFAGIADDKTRANIIAYLATLK